MSMFNIDVDTCQYIGSNDYSVLQPTCCASVVAGRAYCEEHLWQVYKQGTAVKRKKDTRVANAVWDLQNELNTIIEELEDEGVL
jgi:hypothetical protein